MVESQIKIRRAFKNWKLRGLRKDKRFVVDVYFDENVGNFDVVYLVGEFETNSWTDRVKMTYSHFHRAFKAKVVMKEKTYFKFLVNGKYICSNSYPTTPDKDHNIFKLAENKRRVTYLTHKTKSVEWNDTPLLKINNSLDLMLANKTKSYNKPKIMKLSSYSAMTNLISLANKIHSPHHKKPHPNSKIYSGWLSKDGSSKKNKKQKLRWSIEAKDCSSGEKIGEKFRFDKKFGWKKFMNLNDLVTPVMRDPREVFDPLFFGEEDLSNDGVSSKSRNNINCEIKLDHLKGKMQSGLKLMKSYSADDLSKCDNSIQLKFVASGYLISKAKNKSCEDAYFVHGKALGIADGVGGWSRFNINWSLFSKELMKNSFTFWKRFTKLQNLKGWNSKIGWSSKFSSEILQNISSTDILLRRNSNSFCQEQQGGDRDFLDSYSFTEDIDIIKSTNRTRKSFVNTSFEIDPRQIMKHSFKNMKHFGSSTACICTIQGDILKVASLGDSGLIWFRYNKDDLKYKVALCTKDQQHSFNAPFQLARIPNEAYSLNRNHENKTFSNSDQKTQQELFWCDEPDASDMYQLKVKPGDILILGTDGLFDNLFLEDIMDIVEEYTNGLFSYLENKRKFSEKKGCSNNPSKLPLEEDIKSTWISDSRKEMPSFWYNFTRWQANDLAVKLARAARIRSNWKNTLSPFQAKWNGFLTQNLDESDSSKNNWHLQLWQGGKRDDIGVVVSFLA
jgi:serine/threonine protein phosphatase PrpC